MKNEVAGKPCKVEFAHVWPVCIPLAILLAIIGTVAYSQYELYHPTKVYVSANPPAPPAIPDRVDISSKVDGQSTVCWGQAGSCHKLLDLFHPERTFSFTEKGKTRQLLCERGECVEAQTGNQIMNTTIGWPPTQSCWVVGAAVQCEESH